MDITGIIIPVTIIGGLGLFFGVILGFADRIFKVEADPRIDAVRAALPGANCGGCGLAGCDAFAAAVVGGEAKINGCPVGGAACAASIAEILGVEAVSDERLSAYVKCAGNCNVATYRYDYSGINDCRAVTMLAGNGSKSCQYGCLGNGSCKNACQFGAITIENGIAFVDPEKCTSCTMCTKTCPRKLIEMVPVSKLTRVSCNSHDNGKTVRSHCTVGCIGCKLCEKTCRYDAVHVENLLARVDYSKCTNCGECVTKCPTKAIAVVQKRIEA